MCVQAEAFRLGVFMYPCPFFLLNANGMAEVVGWNIVSVLILHTTLIHPGKASVYKLLSSSIFNALDSHTTKKLKPMQLNLWRMQKFGLRYHSSSFYLGKPHLFSHPIHRLWRSFFRVWEWLKTKSKQRNSHNLGGISALSPTDFKFPDHWKENEHWLTNEGLKHCGWETKRCFGLFMCGKTKQQ